MTLVSHSKQWIVSGALAAIVIAFACGAMADLPKRMSSQEQPSEFKDIGIKENLGGSLDLTEKVRNEKGELVTLGTFFDGHRPVILSPVYFACPGLCNYHMNGLTEALKEVDWTPGQKFQVIALSFDAKETPELASKKKEAYMKMYNRPGSEEGFHFLTADADTLKRITGAAGFTYRWDEEQKQWAHGSAAIVLTPDGKIARYLHGIIFDAPTIKMALNEAGQGKVGGFVDQMIWLCFHYDPHLSKYTLYAARIMQIGGALMVLLMAAFLVPAWLRSRRLDV